MVVGVLATLASPALAQKGRLAVRGHILGQPVEGSPARVRIEASGGRAPYTYYFDWNGDGRYEVADATEDTAGYAFLRSGPATIGLAVKDSRGKVATGRLQLVVQNAPPVLKALRVAGPVAEGQPVQVEVDAVDPGGRPLVYAFDWENDGTFDEEKTEGRATHVYGAPGVYVLIVRVRDPDGAVASGAAAAVVKAGGLTVRLDGPGPLVEGAPATLFVRVEGPRVDPVRFEWELGDGARERGERVTHTYRPGRYAARVIATDAAGRSGEASVTLEVANVAPRIARIEAPASIEEGTELLLSVGAEDPGGAQAGLRYAFDWEGDGRFDTTVSDSSAVHLYRTRGDYVVTVRVTDGSGGVAEARRSIRVLRPSGGNLYLLLGFGTGGFIGVTPFRTNDVRRADLGQDTTVPRQPRDTVPGYNIADRTVYGQWPWTMDLDVAYLLGPVAALSLRQTFAVQGGRHYSIQPGLEFWTPRRYVSTYARTALAIHRQPDLVGTNLSLGLLVKLGLPNVALRAEIGIEPLFLGTVRPGANDPTFRETSIAGQGIVLPVLMFFGVAGNLL